jgi:hypothetical protein
MEHYIHDANIAHYRHLIAESERDPKRDEDRHKMLLTLLAEEITKGEKLAADQSAYGSQAHGLSPLLALPRARCGGRQSPSNSI